MSNTLGLKYDSKINDPNLLAEMKQLIFHDNDVRPVWVGDGYATTDDPNNKNYANWANEHWGLYYAFNEDIDKRDNVNILDVGCGSGFCTVNLSHIFNSFTIDAIDIDAKSIDFCNKFNKKSNIEYSIDNLITYVPNKKYDYIFLVETLEHIKHNYHYGIIDVLLNSLTPTGLIFVSTPNETTFFNTERGHVGILTPEYFQAFELKYGSRMKPVKYINNKLLLSGQNYVTNNNTDSHFKIVMKGTV